MRLSEQDGRELLRRARRALESHLGLAAGADPADPDAAHPVGDVPTPDGLGGVFCTVKLDGELRGCIGYVASGLELSGSVARASVAAATGDSRFPRVRRDELARVRISLSVMTQPVLVEDLTDIQLGRDGLIVERDGARGLLLPQVATERNWDRDRFLSETCVKAGLAPDSWSDATTVVCRFEALQYEESG